MRIRTLFHIPEGEKVTDKALGRVLISSICSVLLCMACLVSTTWAWFAVSMENTENVIQIATVTETVTVTGTESNAVIEPTDGAYKLDNGSYKIRVRLTSDATGPDDLNKSNAPVYVLMSVDTQSGAAYYYFSLAGGAGEAEQILELRDAPAALRFSVTWVKPDAAVQIGDEAVTIGEKSTESTTADKLTVSATTEPSIAPSETTVPAESD